MSVDHISASANVDRSQALKGALPKRSYMMPLARSRALTAPPRIWGASRLTSALVSLAFIAALGLLLGSWAWAQADAQAGEVLFVCKHGNVKSLMAASYFNRLAMERGLPYRASSRGSDVDTPEVPTAIAGELRDEGFDVSAFRARSATADDVRAAKHIVLIETSLPGASDAAAAKVERWDDVPPASVHYPAASAALKARVEKLLDQLASR